jgi:CheY-like chemotaxis protein
MQPISLAVSPHLPFLRRYARALTGRQESGDAYVAATLEALLADPALIDDPLGPRVALYRLFARIWNSVSGQSPAEVRPLSRQASLLVALEGFSEADAAHVLDIDVAELRTLIEEAGREHAAETAVDVLIIGEDAFIAMDLEMLLEGRGHRVVGIARTPAEALALASKKRPAVILADVRLRDGRSDLDAVSELSASLQAPVVFITAYPERLLTGERAEPAFLIGKPFQHSSVAALLSRAIALRRDSDKRDATAMRPA